MFHLQLAFTCSGVGQLGPGSKPPVTCESTRHEQAFWPCEPSAHSQLYSWPSEHPWRPSSQTTADDRGEPSEFGNALAQESVQLTGAATSGPARSGGFEPPDELEPPDAPLVFEPVGETGSLEPESTTLAPGQAA